MLAIISDLHANVEALTAVFADIAQQKVDKIYCLGDVVGYGPDPVIVTDMVRERAEICLEGNHDEALAHGPLGFNLPATQAIECSARTSELRTRIEPTAWKLVGAFRPGSTTGVGSGGEKFATTQTASSSTAAISAAATVHGASTDTGARFQPTSVRRVSPSPATIARSAASMSHGSTAVRLA